MLNLASSLRRRYMLKRNPIIKKSMFVLLASLKLSRLCKLIFPPHRTPISILLKAHRFRNFASGRLFKRMHEGRLTGSPGMIASNEAFVEEKAEQAH